MLPLEEKALSEVHRRYLRQVVAEDLPGGDWRLLHGVNATHVARPVRAQRHSPVDLPYGLVWGATGMSLARANGFARQRAVREDAVRACAWVLVWVRMGAGADAVESIALSLYMFSLSPLSLSLSLPLFWVWCGRGCGWGWVAGFGWVRPSEHVRALTCVSCGVDVGCESV